MAYIPTQWKTGDVITAEKLNKLEQGVQNEQTGPQGEKGEAGIPGADGKGIKAITLTTDSSGKVTGGTVTFTDDSTAPITVTATGE